MEAEKTNIWEQVTSQDALTAAWFKVDANEGSAGGDGVSRGEFGADKFARLMQLRADLLGGDYAPRPYRRVSIPKKKPGFRILTIPSIRDRVLHTSIAEALTPILEPQFQESSFAYRPNRGVSQAVQRIEHWRDRGYDIVIEADIVWYFDNIDHDLLFEKLESALSVTEGAEPLLALVRQMLAHQAEGLGTPGVGLVQGSPMSPILANLYLDALDEEIETDGVKLIRFADDFVILCKSKKKAERALAHCVEVLERHRLRLHESGTRIVNFDKGFDFIGYLFLRSLALKEKGDAATHVAKPVKSEVTEDGVIHLGEVGSKFDQGHRVLYVLDPSHRLTSRNRSFSVCQEDGKELIAISNRRVGRIGEKGMIWATVRATGTSTHAAHVHKGDSAIEKLMSVMEALKGLRAYPVDDAGSNVIPFIDRWSEHSEAISGAGETDVLKQVTVTFGTFSGGRLSNLVADRAEFTCDVRLPVGVSVAEIEAEMTGICSETEDVELEVTRRYEPSWTPPDHPIIEAVHHNCTTILGAEPAVTMRVGASDARLYRYAGVPTVVCGLTAYNLGAPDEHIMLDELLDLVDIFALSAHDYLSANV